MRLHFYIFPILLTFFVVSCDLETVRPPSFVLPVGDVYTELHKDRLTQTTVYTTCFEGNDFYKGKLTEGLAIAPQKAPIQGSYMMHFYALDTIGLASSGNSILLDSTMLRAQTDVYAYDSMAMKKNLGLYKFYILSKETNERSYTEDALTFVPSDTVISGNVNYAAYVLRFDFVWDPFPGATEYELCLIDRATQLVIFHYVIPASSSTGQFSAYDTTHGWAKYPIVGNPYEGRIYSRQRDSQGKIVLSTYASTMFSGYYPN